MRLVDELLSKNCWTEVVDGSKFRLPADDAGVSERHSCEYVCEHMIRTTAAHKTKRTGIDSKHTRRAASLSSNLYVSIKAPARGSVVICQTPQLQQTRNFPGQLLLHNTRLDRTVCIEHTYELCQLAVLLRVEQ